MKMTAKKLGRTGIFFTVLCILLLILSLFFSIYILEHVDHSCTGAHCFICICLKSSTNNLKNISACFLAFASIGFASGIIRSICIHICFIFEKTVEIIRTDRNRNFVCFVLIIRKIKPK